jgi:AcrR family transcriptional regulator
MAREVRENGAPTKRRNRKEEVLQAAVQIFHEKSYASASIQDVADSVGVLKGSLYHYIDSKEDLLARIFEESDEQSFALMEEIQALDISAVERLRSFARSWSLWYLQNIERTAIYINEWKHLTGERLKRTVATRHEYDNRVRRMIDDVKREGDADPNLNTRYATFFLLSAINGLPTWYRRGGPDSAEHIAEVYSDMIVGMVCNSDGRKSPRKAAKAKPKARAKAKAKAKAKSA